MSRRPTIGLAVIARDEQATLPNLLESIGDTFDHVVLVDTGSTDNTVNVFKTWAAETGQAHTLGTFAWIDDFSAARNHAHGLLRTDWHCWADADDTITGAHHLHAIADAVPPNAQAVIFDHHHPAFAFQDVEGDIARRLLRLYRAGTRTWVDPVHETLRGDGIDLTGPDHVHWTHLRTDWTESAARNSRIYAHWLDTDPVSLVEHLETRLRAEATSAGHLATALNGLLDGMDYHEAREVLHAHRRQRLDRPTPSSPPR